MSSKQTKPSFVKNEMERRLQLLYQITSQTKKSLNEQLNNALELTTKLLDMEVGIISSISDKSYVVRNFFPLDSGLSEEQVFDLGSTYCSITLQSEDVVAINHMKESEFERHPCYAAFSLESYIGIPILIDSEVYGTINFSSSKPKNGKFKESDFTLIRLLGEWVGATIKRAEIQEALKESNNRYKLISSNSADLICLHDLDGRYEFISPSVETILGYNYEELLGKNHSDLIYPEDFEMLKGEPFQILKEEGVVTSIRYRIQNKEADYIWFESSVKTIFDENNKPIGLQSISREVTERKRLEVMFEQTQEMANVGGWEFDLETGRLFWTDEVYRIHDIEIGTQIEVDEGVSYFPGEAKDKIEAAIEMTIETGKQYDLVLPFVSKKGNNKWVRAKGRAHFQVGKAVSLSGTFQDISKQMAYEERIVTQNEELLKLTETRDKLYSIIAHDLKGAFFGINGMLEILTEELEDDNIEKDKSLGKLKLVNVSSKNAYELLENMLEWIKIQNNELKIEEQELNLKLVIDKSISILKSATANKGIEIVRNIEIEKVIGDKNMLSTVFRNLISNAIKYSNKGSQIIIRANEVGNFVEVSIKDFGVGMPEKIKKALFDKENRPQRRGTSYEKGTGLGLLLCSDMIKAHKGEIDVISQEEKGSEFIVRLPK